MVVNNVDAEKTNKTFPNKCLLVYNAIVEKDTSTKSELLSITLKPWSKSLLNNPLKTIIKKYAAGKTNENLVNCCNRNFFFTSKKTE